MTRLSAATAGALPYDRAVVKTGVVHLGIGAFHRAHQAPVFDAAIAAGDPRWGIVGASLRSAGVRDQLAPQDGLYTLVIRDGADERLQMIGAVRDVLVAPEDPAVLVELMASADVHIVTLTVTEKGYKLDPATGRLLTDDPDVAADLESLAAPRTAPGFIVAALARRRAAGLAPFTAMSCDNIPHNGARLRDAVLAIAAQHDRTLADWIAAHGAFPQTMIDRIVPATSLDDIIALHDRTGQCDQGMVKAEPFTQWVIEDRFAGPRPDFAAFGVQLTSAVAPWEEAKLRLLNGAHSSIAYLGGLAGIDHVDGVVALPEARAFVEALWDEAEATLNPPAELDVAAYRAALMARFANPALQHRNRQIAMDGSQKLPQRLVAPIVARRAEGLPVDALALGVAAWMRWQIGRDDAGRAYVVDDPLAAVTADRLAGLDDPADMVRALLSIDAIFTPDLANDTVFVATVTRHLSRLLSEGALATLNAWKSIS
ncbi:mannitol dehydrogenase family protein [Sphingomonas montanisoli]|uniref:Mannitol dehydrogenase family protein n=1 Tax=Sphingomonas montanisoli TaxID=2606412 RepID=A0A5D9C872_9SPHN|nr:mannitol dehydrogenase family protein [Sphingomonas montanisoli]TZG27322.1 mannitol dehydrogenase family protein [Sphingomonas montanisoli]